MDTRDQTLNPLVSIVLPVHNEALWLTECVVSLIDGTYKNIEVIIIDDASQDQSLLLAHELQERFPKVVSVVHFPQTQGEGAVRSRGIGVSRGHYIVQTDADALFPPDFIEQSMAYLKKYKTDGLSIGEIKVHPRRVGVLANYWRAKRYASYTLRRLGKKGSIIGMYIFSRQVALGLDGYTTDVPSAVDFDFAMRAHRAGFTSQWAEKIFFYHADETNWIKFFKRLLNASRFNAPIQKKWTRWLSPWQQTKEIFHCVVYILFFLGGWLGFINELFFLLWIVLGVIEGFVPLIAHRETRMIIRICVERKYWSTLLLIPVITALRVRASNFGKVYAVLFPIRTAQAITFDV